MRDTKTGIVDQIRMAKTEKTIDSLLHKLRGYEYASAKTISRAHRTADKRRAELGLKGAKK